MSVGPALSQAQGAALADTQRRDAAFRAGSLIWIRGSNPKRKELPVPNKKDRAERRERQDREFQENQRELRTSIAETEPLVGEADVMIRRHRDECDAAEGK